MQDRLEEMRIRKNLDIADGKDVEESISIGENIIPRAQYSKRRTFAINASHSVPYLRQNEFRRLQRSMKSILNIDGTLDLEK